MLKILNDIQEASQRCISFVNQFSNTSKHKKVHPFTSNYYWLKAAAVGDPFIVKLLWTRSWHHYSPAYQWRGSTRRAPCRNKEAGEEASAFPHPCRDEPPTGNTESSATLITSSNSPQSRQVNCSHVWLFSVYRFLRGDTCKCIK